MPAVVFENLSDAPPLPITKDLSRLRGIVQSVGAAGNSSQSFHTHAVAGYATWADADGAPLTQVQAAAVSQKADQSFSVLGLLQGVGDLAEQFKTVLSAFQTPAGKAMNLAQDPATATGFLGFMNTAQSMVGVIGNVFDLGPDAVMPKFFPGSDVSTPAQIKTLGLNEYA